MQPIRDYQMTSNAVRLYLLVDRSSSARLSQRNVLPTLWPCGHLISEAMSSGIQVSGRALAPPRAAAVAGLIFAVLLILALAIVRVAAGDEEGRPGTWLTDPARRSAIRLALHLVPFVGVSFLWFLGVIRNRLAELEDKFFATVFLGSGLLFVASLSASAAVAVSVALPVETGRIPAPDLWAYSFGRRLSGALLNIFAIKMAGVFIFSTCTIALRTAIFPRWVAYCGFACGLVLLLAITSWPWIALLFPVWILLVSLHILAADIRRSK